MVEIGNRGEGGWRDHPSVRAGQPFTAPGTSLLRTIDLVVVAPATPGGFNLGQNLGKLGTLPLSARPCCLILLATPTGFEAETSHPGLSRLVPKSAVFCGFRRIAIPAHTTLYRAVPARRVPIGCQFQSATVDIDGRRHLLITPWVFESPSQRRQQPQDTRTRMLRDQKPLLVLQWPASPRPTICAFRLATWGSH